MNKAEQFFFDQAGISYRPGRDGSPGYGQPYTRVVEAELALEAMPEWLSTERGINVLDW